MLGMRRVCCVGFHGHDRKWIVRSIPDDEGAESTVERQRQVELEVVETRCSGMTREISMRSMEVNIWYPSETFYSSASSYPTDSISLYPYRHALDSQELCGKGTTWPIYKRIDST